jgi:aspartate/methionine/tyrosine aminotransferase
MSSSHGVSSLTADEVKISATECIDLGPGYPDDRPSGEVLEIWMKACADHIDEPLDSSERTRATDSLAEAVLGFLSIQGGSLRVLPASNGSTALHRALMAAIQPRQPVLLASPIIDIIPGMVSESRSSRVRVAQPIGGSLRVDYAALAYEIENTAPGCCVVVSPLNPTGQVTTADELRMVATACRAAGTRLVVDQCFAETSPWGTPVPHIAELVSEIEGLEWLEVWDTGKTFGCNDAKLGFIIGEGKLLAAAEEALHLVQFDIPHVLKSFFSQLFTSPSAAVAMRDAVSAAALVNLNALQKAASRISASVITPEAGTLALIIAAAGTPLSKPEAHNRLLREAGVGVIDGMCFLFGKTGNPLRRHRGGLLRFALARNPTYFAEGLARIERWLATDRSIS